MHSRSRHRRTCAGSSSWCAPRPTRRPPSRRGNEPDAGHRAPRDTLRPLGRQVQAHATQAHAGARGRGDLRTRRKRWTVVTRRGDLARRSGRTRCIGPRWSRRWWHAERWHAGGGFSRGGMSRPSGGNFQRGYSQGNLRYGGAQRAFGVASSRSFNRSGQRNYGGYGGGDYGGRAMNRDDGAAARERGIAGAGRGPAMVSPGDHRAITGRRGRQAPLPRGPLGAANPVHGRGRPGRRPRGAPRARRGERSHADAGPSAAGLGAHAGSRRTRRPPGTTPGRPGAALGGFVKAPVGAVVPYVPSSTPPASAAVGNVV